MLKFKKKIILDQKSFFDLNAIFVKEQGAVEKGFFHEYAFKQVTKGFRWIGESCERVLDYGCGIGLTLEQYLVVNAGREVDIVGVDISENCIRVIEQKYPNGKFEVIEDNDLSFLNDESVDACYIVHVLHHSEKHADIYSELYRVCEKGGKLLVVDLTSTNLLINISRSLFLFSLRFITNKFSDDLVIDGDIPEKLTVIPSEVVEGLEGLGFVVEKIDHGHLFLFVLDWFSKITNMSLPSCVLAFLLKIEKKLLKYDFFKKRAHLFCIYARKI